MKVEKSLISLTGLRVTVLAAVKIRHRKTTVSDLKTSRQLPALRPGIKGKD
jgi:hypothetical protein